MPESTILRDHVDAILSIASILDAIAALAFGHAFEA